MGLSEHEQRLLEEMEKRFYASEADSVDASQGLNARPSYRAIVFAVIAVVVGVLTLIAAVSLGYIWLGAIGFLVMLAGLFYASSPKNQVQQTGEPNMSSNKSFSEKLEKRWEERMDGER